VEYDSLGYIMPQEVTPSMTSDLLYKQDLLTFMSEEPLDFGMVKEVTPFQDMDVYGFTSNMGQFNNLLEDIQIKKQEAQFNQAVDAVREDTMNRLVDSKSASKDYYKKLAKVESGGDYNAYNKGSGATGKYQFLKGTAEPILKGMGKTWDDFKKNPALQDKVVKKFTEQNAEYLRKHNVPVNDETLWWAHNQGAGGAVNLYKGGEVSSRNLRANGAPSGTTAEYIERWKPIFG